MSSMALFIGLCLILSVAIGLLVILIDSNSTANKKSADNQLMAVNVASYQARIAELQQDAEDGRVSQQHYQQQQVELQRQLIQAQTEQKHPPVFSNITKLILLLSIPVLTGLVYFAIGNRNAVFAYWQADDKLAQVADDLLTGKINTPPDWAVQTQADSQALITSMQANLHQHSYDPQRWLKMADLYEAMGNGSASIQAKKRAYRMQPDNSELALAYAQTLLIANGGAINADSKQVLSEVLASNLTQSDKQKALMLLMMGEATAGNHQQALAWLEQLRKTITNNPQNVDQQQRLESLANLDKLEQEIHKKWSSKSNGV